MSRAGLLPAALAFVTGCGGCSPTTPPGDTASASEAGVPNGRADAPAAPDGHADAPVDAPAEVQPPTGKPVWEALAFDVVGCSVERLVNASELTLFNWGACPSMSNCDQALFNPHLVASDAGLTPRTRVVDDGTTTRLVAAAYDEHLTDFSVYLADEDGHLHTGFRTQNSATTTCT